MRIKNFHRLVPVSFQFYDYSSDEREIALVDLDDRIVHIWNEDLQRYIPAGDSLEAAVLAKFDDVPVNILQPPSNIIAQANKVRREVISKYEVVKERVKQDEFRETDEH